MRAGRRREFAAHGWAAEDVPDPQDPVDGGRVDARLVGSVPAGPHAAMLDWYRSLIALRRAEPWLSDPRLDLVSVAYDAGGALGGGDPRAAAGGGEPGCLVCRSVPVDGVVSSVLLSSSPDVAVGGSAGLELPAESVAVVRLAAS